MGVYVYWHYMLGTGVCYAVDVFLAHGKLSFIGKSLCLGRAWFNMEGLNLKNLRWKD